MVGTVSAVETQGTQTRYTGPDGVAILSASGELTVEFAPGSLLSQSLILDRLSALGVSLTPSGGEGVYTQLWEGVPVSGMTARLTSGPQGPQTLTLSPQVLRGEEELLPAEDTLTAATALTRLLDELSRGEGYVCSQIAALYPGYLPSGSGPVTLTPAWFIDTDAWRFLVDGLTGTVTAAE